MTDHTPEPWAFYNGQPRQNQRGHMAKVCVVDKDDPTCVAYGQTLEEARANAARIVACVNACADIPTEQLPPGEMVRLRAELRRIADGLEQRRRHQEALAPFQED